MNNDEIELVVAKYCGNGMELLKRICYPIMMKFGWCEDLDRDDFYSIANETVWQAAKQFQSNEPDIDKKIESFEIFLRICICKKFKTEMTRKNRKKRIPKQKIYSIYAAIGTDDERTYADTLASDFDICNEVDGLRDDGLDKFISRLSRKQFQIVELIIIGFEKEDIKKILGIDDKRYDVCIGNMRNFETRILLTGKDQ